MSNFAGGFTINHNLNGCVVRTEAVSFNGEQHCESVSISALEEIMSCCVGVSWLDLAGVQAIEIYTLNWSSNSTTFTVVGDGEVLAIGRLAGPFVEGEVLLPDWIAKFEPRIPLVNKW